MFKVIKKTAYQRLSRHKNHTRAYPLGLIKNNFAFAIGNKFLGITFSTGNIIIYITKKPVK
jgi:hypothetical protein